MLAPALAALDNPAKREAPTLDITVIEREAAALAPGPFGYFLWLEARLVAAGFPPVSPWWREQLRAFYASGKRWLVVMAGRGAGKSTMLTRVAVCESLFTARTAAPGEEWVWPFVSVATADARRRILQIQSILAAIGINAHVSYPQGHPTIAEVIETIEDDKGKVKKVHEPLTDMRGNKIAFVAFASTIAALSGPTSIGATVDEEAKLRGEGANPGAEVIATLLQTFRARPGIRAIRCSSAWLTSGSHYGAIDAGDTAANHIARIGSALPEVRAGLDDVARWEEEHGDPDAAARIRAHAATLTERSPNAPTWIGNPTIGSPDGKPWAGAAVASRIEVEAMPPEALEGLTRADFWLRENASVPRRTGAQGDEALARARVTVVAPPARVGLSDVVIGVSPSVEGSPEWGIAIVGVGASGFVAVADSSIVAPAGTVSGLLATLGQGHRASVLVVAKEHEARLRDELAAGLAGLATWAPPVAGVDVYDGSTLRTGPLRSLLDSGRLTVATGLTGLGKAIAMHRPGSRSPRVEALAAAVSRLVACYPWAAQVATQPVTGPRPRESMLTGGSSVGEMLARLGATDARAWVR